MTQDHDMTIQAGDEAGPFRQVLPGLEKGTAFDVSTSGGGTCAYKFYFMCTRMKIHNSLFFNTDESVIITYPSFLLCY
jgi:hypothetical protein